MNPALVFTLLISQAQAYTTFFSQCPATVDTIPVFFTSLYTGRWYEISRDMDTPFEWMSDCVTATYTAEADSLIGVNNRSWNWWTFFNYQTALGKAKCSNEGKCYVTFNALDTNYDNTNYNYNILMTDYVSYSVVYSCAPAWLWTS